MEVVKALHAGLSVSEIVQISRSPELLFTVKKRFMGTQKGSLERFTEKLKAFRHEKCKKIRSILEKKTPIILFLDELYFTVNPVSNSCHDQFISSLKVSDIPDKFKFAPQTKYPLQIMIFGLVSSNGKKIPPVFLHSKLKMGAQDIERVLKPHVLPWVQANYTIIPANYVFMQNGTLCHKTNITQQWLADHLKFWPKNIWPPTSPDLNHLDFRIWAKVQAQACKKQNPNTDQLISSVSLACTGLTGKCIKKTCSRFQSQVEAVIIAEGSYINVN